MSPFLLSPTSTSSSLLNPLSQRTSYPSSSLHPYCDDLALASRQQNLPHAICHTAASKLFLKQWRFFYLLQIQWLFQVPWKVMSGSKLINSSLPLSALVPLQRACISCFPGTTEWLTSTLPYGFYMQAFASTMPYAWNVFCRLLHLMNSYSSFQM